MSATNHNADWLLTTTFLHFYFNFYSQRLLKVLQNQAIFTKHFILPACSLIYS